MRQQHGGGIRNRLALTLALLVVPGTVVGQTFVQLTDMGSNIGPRLTRNVANNRISRSLFGAIGTKVTFINNGTPYQFATDPLWARVVIGKKDDWIHDFKNGSGPGGKLGAPYGIDISARKNTYIADWLNRRVLIATFSTSGGNLTSPRNLTASGAFSGFGRPIDVAWDGRSAPLTNDFLYVLDDSLGRITYWDFNGATPTSPLWTYGSTGTGTGQFRRPSGLCVGKTGAGTGGTAFTTAIFVVDRGNKRVVYLYRGATGPVWTSVITQPNWDPVDCTVDHFGQLYITDRAGDKVWKFNSALWLLDQYGTYGTGANNLNTFADPGAISAPCGLKTVNSVTVWYCEGRIITAERWGDSTGAVEHYLGVSASFNGPPSVGDPSASISLFMTDVSYITADVIQMGVGTAKNLMTNVLYSAGQVTLYWDGKLTNGQVAPDGNYMFRAYIRSSYGCPNNNQYVWCAPNLYSAQFFHRYCTPPPPGGNGILATEPESTANPQTVPPPPVCGSGGQMLATSSARVELGVPRSFGVRQLAGTPAAIPEGLSALNAAPGVRPSLSVSGSDIPASPGAEDAVRQFGITALQVNLSQPSDVAVEIFDMTGRLVRRSHSVAQPPGMYIFHWSGLRDDGQTVRPGVYLTVVRAQGRKSVAKLIVTGAASP